MIDDFDPALIDYLFHIDIRSYEWPWVAGAWSDLDGYLIRVYSMKSVPRGYIAYKIGNNSLEVPKLCVNPTFRRMGIGSALMKDLVVQAIKLQKTKLCMTVHEHCKFFGWLNKRGWEAVGVVRGIFPDGSDGYLFERSVMR